MVFLSEMWKSLQQANIFAVFLASSEIVRGISSATMVIPH
jgi:hypothetical protein